LFAKKHAKLPENRHFGSGDKGATDLPAVIDKLVAVKRPLHGVTAAEQHIKQVIFDGEPEVNKGPDKKERVSQIKRDHQGLHTEEHERAE
jgi:hypothetical protein